MPEELFQNANNDESSTLAHWDRFVGENVYGVDINHDSLVLMLETGAIILKGKWALFDDLSRIIDRSMDLACRSDCSIWRIGSKEITSIAIGDVVTISLSDNWSIIAEMVTDKTPDLIVYTGRGQTALQ